MSLKLKLKGKVKDQNSICRSLSTQPHTRSLKFIFFSHTFKYHDSSLFSRSGKSKFLQVRHFQNNSINSLSWSCDHPFSKVNNTIGNVVKALQSVLDTNSQCRRNCQSLCFDVKHSALCRCLVSPVSWYALSYIIVTVSVIYQTVPKLSNLSGW